MAWFGWGGGGFSVLIMGVVDGVGRGAAQEGGSALTSSHPDKALPLRAAGCAERASDWQELPPGHFISGKTPKLHQFALTPEQLQVRLGDGGDAQGACVRAPFRTACPPPLGPQHAALTAHNQCMRHTSTVHTYR